MADETIFGCVDWATGKVQFYQTYISAPPCGWCDDGEDDDCVYSGCVIWTGIHAGQVEVTINSIECDDTYYACVNWGTGKFQLIVPDNCCRGSPHAQPGYIDVTISGLTDCPCHYSSIRGYEKSFGIAAACNGTFRCAHNNGCVYDWQEEGDYGYSEKYWDVDCESLYSTAVYTIYRVVATLFSTKVRVEALLHGGPGVFFDEEDYGEGEECGEISGTFNNMYDCEDGYYCYGGTATISIEGS